ncbi:MAG: type II secretion system minor pseudopilin GspK [Candidatus Hydrogenedentota bacterium]
MAKSRHDSWRRRVYGVLGRRGAQENGGGHRAGIRNERGVALMLALLFVVLLTALVVEYMYESNVDAAFVQGYASEVETYIAARSAVANGIALLELDLLQAYEAEGELFDSLHDPWAQGVQFQPINDAIMQCRIEDEFGKINLNALMSRDGEERNEVLIRALEALFRMRGAEEDVVEAIVEWMDPQGAGTDRGERESEDGYYETLDIPYGSKQAPMDSVEELLLVQGVTPELFYGDPEEDQLPLPRLLTVNGHPEGQINVNTAAFETLEAMGEALDGRLALADVVIRERESAPFTDRENLESRGVYSPPRSRRGRGRGEGRDVRHYVTVQSSMFKLIGDGMMDNAAARIEAHVWRDPDAGAGGLRILDWRITR